MSSLILLPALNDVSRADIEAHLEAVRARRMVATIEYHNIKNEKVKGKADKIRLRLDAQAEMLKREILALDRMDEKIMSRLVVIEGLRQEIGLLDDMVQENVGE